MLMTLAECISLTINASAILIHCETHCESITNVCHIIWYQLSQGWEQHKTWDMSLTLNIYLMIFKVNLKKVMNIEDYFRSARTYIIDYF